MLQPDCPTMPYCFADNNCSTTCVDRDTFTCHWGTLFYPLANACGDSTLPYCRAPSSSTGNDVTYRVKALLVVTITTVGLNVYRLNTTADVIEVNPGDVIGFSTKGGSGRIGTGPVGDVETKDRIFNIDTPSVGDSLDSAHSLSVERHLLTVRQQLDRSCIPRHGSGVELRTLDYGTRVRILCCGVKTSGKFFLLYIAPVLSAL